MPSVATEARQRFGFEVDGLRLLTPVDRPAQFLPSAAIYPLPLAPRRLRGLTQVRGHPVSVVDVRPAAPTRLPTGQRHALLIVGDPALAPIGFLVDAPPMALRRVDQTPPLPTPPAPDFGPALGAAVACAPVDGGDVSLWWDADFSALFEALMADR